MNTLLMERILQLKQNSIANLKREESLNHLREKILRFKNLVFDKIESRFGQMQGQIMNLVELRRKMKTLLQSNCTKLKVLNQTLSCSALEIKSLKNANNQLHIGNNELNKRIGVFEELGFQTMTEAQLREMQQERLRKIKLVCKDYGVQTKATKSPESKSCQTEAILPKKIHTGDFGS